MGWLHKKRRQWLYLGGMKMTFRFFKPSEDLSKIILKELKKNNTTPLYVWDFKETNEEHMNQLREHLSIIHRRNLFTYLIRMTAMGPIRFMYCDENNNLSDSAREYYDATLGFSEATNKSIAGEFKLWAAENPNDPGGALYEVIDDKLYIDVSERKKRMTREESEREPARVIEICRRKRK